MEISLSDLKELLASKQEAPIVDRNLGQQIVVLDRGFVYVGSVEVKDGMVLIHDAKNIRVWGTTGVGLGELRNGPRSETKTDFAGEVIVPFKAVIHFIQCKGF